VIPPQSTPSAITIALIANDVIGDRMAGPGIRYWEFARVLGRHFKVKLIVPPLVPMEDRPIVTEFPATIHICRQVSEFQKIVTDCDVIITLGVILLFYPFLQTLGKPLVLDMYNPFLLEDLQREAQSDLLQRLVSHENYLAAIRTQLNAGDFFICAGEKQRDYWLGTLSSMGRVNPYTYQQDSTLRHLIDIVPFGLPTKPPQHTHPVLKGVYKTIAAEDKVILWGGGIWNWFDAPTLIRAMSLILKERQDVKLFFMGINRPNKDVPKMRAVDEAISLSRQLDLYDKFVFFNDWVPYEERQNYLLEADLGVSLHLDHIETRFSFRTRLLDNLWAGLPVVSTEGDVLGESLAAQGLAVLVQPGDVEGVTRTILDLLNNPSLRAEYQARFQQVAAAYRWEAVCQPLLRFCQAPYFSPDKAYLHEKSQMLAPTGSSQSLWTKGVRALKMGGISGLWQQTRQYIRWRVRKFQKL